MLRMRNVIIEFLSLLVCVLNNLWTIGDMFVFYVYFFLLILHLHKFLYHLMIKTRLEMYG